MIYDHHKGALQSDQQNMHDTTYCVMTIIVNKSTKNKQKNTDKVCKNNAKRNNYECMHLKKGTQFEYR